LQRQSSGGGAQRSSSGDGPAPKRARKPSAAAKNQSHHLTGELDLHGGGELELFQDEGEDMLFEPDSFEELKAHAQRDALHSNHHNSGGMGMEDDGDFSSLVNMNHAASMGGGTDMNMHSMDTWTHQ
jgi:hypothetical protein